MTEKGASPQLHQEVCKSTGGFRTSKAIQRHIGGSRGLVASVSPLAGVSGARGSTTPNLYATKTQRTASGKALRPRVDLNCGG